MKLKNLIESLSEDIWDELDALFKKGDYVTYYQRQQMPDGKKPKLKKWYGEEQQSGKTTYVYFDGKYELNVNDLFSKGKWRVVINDISVKSKRGVFEKEKLKTAEEAKELGLQKLKELI